MKDFELALSELLDSYRRVIDKEVVIVSMRRQLDDVEDNWPKAIPVTESTDYVPGQTLPKDEDDDTPNEPPPAA